MNMLGIDNLIRPAVAADIADIARIINDYAERGVMLHRSLLELYEHLRDFQIISVDNQVVAVAGLRIMWSNLAEVYALAVRPDYKGQGLGKALVLRLIQEARHLGIRRVFALTYEKIFFERCDFIVADRQALPMKVWSECVRCSKNAACDEIAVIRELQDVPEVVAPPTLSQPGRIEVPISINQRPLSILPED